jgi:hypothetical protein
MTGMEINNYVVGRLRAFGEQTSLPGGLCSCAIRNDERGWHVATGINPDDTLEIFTEREAKDALRVAHDATLSALVGGYRNVRDDGSLGPQH